MGGFFLFWFVDEVVFLWILRKRDRRTNFLRFDFYLLKIEKEILFYKGVEDRPTNRQTRVPADGPSRCEDESNNYVKVDFKNFGFVEYDKNHVT